MAALYSKSLFFLNSPQSAFPSTTTKPKTHTQITFPLKIHLQNHQISTILHPNLSNEQLIEHPFRFSSSLLPNYIKNGNEIENETDSVSVMFPSVAYSNTLFFKSAYNLQVIVGDHEPEEKLVGRFRSAVLRAGIIQECKRRRFFENAREKLKRKTREASRRYRKRRPQPRVAKEDIKEEKQTEGSKSNGYESGDDNWDFKDR